MNQSQCSVDSFYSGRSSSSSNNGGGGGIESNDGRWRTIGGLHERTPDFANVAGPASGCRP